MENNTINNTNVKMEELKMENTINANVEIQEEVKMTTNNTINANVNEVKEERKMEKHIELDKLFELACRKETYAMQTYKVDLDKDACVSKVFADAIAQQECELFRSGMVSGAAGEKFITFKHPAAIDTVDYQFTVSRNTNNAAKSVTKLCYVTFNASQKADSFAVEALVSKVLDECVFFLDPAMYANNDVWQGKLVSDFTGVNIAVKRDRGWERLLLPNLNTEENDLTPILEEYCLTHCSFLAFTPSGIGKGQAICVSSSVFEDNKDWEPEKVRLLDKMSAGGFSLNAHGERKYAKLAKDLGRFPMSLSGNKCIGNLKSFVYAKAAFSAPSTHADENGRLVEGLDGGASFSVSCMRRLTKRLFGSEETRLFTARALGQIFFQGRTLGGMTKFAASVQQDSYIRLYVEQQIKLQHVHFVTDLAKMNEVIANTPSNAVIVYGMTEKEFAEGGTPDALFDKNNVKITCDFAHEDALKLYVMQVGHRSGAHTGIQTVLPMLAEHGQSFLALMENRLQAEIDGLIERYDSPLGESKVENILIDPNEYIGDTVSKLIPDARRKFQNLFNKQHKDIREKLKEILFRKRVELQGEYLHSAGDPCVIFGFGVLNADECYIAGRKDGEECDVVRYPKASVGEHAVLKCVSLKTIHRRLEDKVAEGVIDKKVAASLYGSFFIKGECYFIIPNTDQFKDLTGGSDNDWDGFSCIFDQEWLEFARKTPSTAVHYSNDNCKQTVARIWTDGYRADDLKTVFVKQAFAPTEKVGVSANRNTKILSTACCTDDKVVFDVMENCFMVKQADAVSTNPYTRQCIGSINVDDSYMESVRQAFLDSDRSVTSFRNYCMDVSHIYAAVEGSNIDAAKNGTTGMKFHDSIDSEAAYKSGTINKMLHSKLLVGIDFFDSTSGDGKDVMSVGFDHVDDWRVGDKYITVVDPLVEVIERLGAEAAEYLTKDHLEGASLENDECILKGVEDASTTFDKGNINMLARILRNIQSAELPSSAKKQMMTIVKNSIHYAFPNNNPIRKCDDEDINLALYIFFAALEASVSKQANLTSLWTVFEDEVILASSFLNGGKNIKAGAICYRLPDASQSAEADFVNGVSDFGICRSKINGKYSLNFGAKSKKWIANTDLKNVFKVSKPTDTIVLPLKQTTLSSDDIRLLNKVAEAPDNYICVCYTALKTSTLSIIDKATNEKLATIDLGLCVPYKQYGNVDESLKHKKTLAECIEEFGAEKGESIWQNDHCFYANRVNGRMVKVHALNSIPMDRGNAFALYYYLVVTVFDRIAIGSSVKIGEIEHSLKSPINAKSVVPKQAEYDDLSDW